MDRLLRQVVVRLAIAGAIGTVFVLLLAPAAFSWVFGPRWEVSGTFAQILVPAFAVQVVASPVTQLLSLLGRQLTQLWWDASRLVLTSGSVVVTTTTAAPATVTVAALAASMIVAYSTVLILVARAARAHRDALRGSSGDAAGTLSSEDCVPVASRSSADLGKPTTVR